VAHRAGRGDQRPTRRGARALRSQPGKTAEVADLLDRYGDAIERDLAFRTPYRLSDFLRGDETPNTLWNLVTAFEELSDTWLAAAKATDVELYEQTRHLPRRRSSPLLVEETAVVSLLKGILELLQQDVHYTAAAAPPKTKRPKVRRLPRPKTAAHLWAAAEARRAHEHVESVLVFVPEDQWRAASGQSEANGGG
jgi:hypothetical protein